jgi:hypothetical protein
MPRDTAAPLALIDRYFDGWNAHDAGQLARTFGAGGTYEDPTTDGAVLGAHIARVIEPLCAAFPDLAVERSKPIGDGSQLSVEWILRGHNLGAFRPGLAPTLKPAVLRGVNVFDLGDAGIRSVRSYFDVNTFVHSFGLAALVQPIEQGPAKFGYAMRVGSGNGKPPGIVALTWIEAASEAEKDRIRAHARENVSDFLAEPGFISIVTGFTGLRGFTVTAWEDEAAMKRALGKHHAIAMRELFGENFVASVWTSVWTPARINRLWLRCPSCASLEDVSDDHRTCSACDAPLPPRPAYW